MKMSENHSFEADLLCDEGTKGFFIDDGDQTNGRTSSSYVNGLSGIPLPSLSEECIGWMVERECLHFPAEDYLSRLRSGELDINFRNEALDWMLKACSYHNFGELCLYLAMNYLDRFLSVYNLPRGKKWVIHLVALSCFSIAAKVSEANVPSLVDLQAGEPNFLFEGKTIQRMEIVVLNSLKWAMKAYTPLNFLDYFLRKMKGDEIPLGDLVSRSIQIVLSTLKGIEFLQFRASEIAAAVAVCVCFSGKVQAKDIDEALSSVIGVDKDRVLKCLDLISVTTSNRAIRGVNGSVSLSLPHSPIGVLDAACFSYKSGETNAGSWPSSSHTSPERKRRRLDEHGS